MARPQKEGLSYFPLDCDFFTNRKIKALRRAHGTLGVLTYLNLLCKVYKNGYYLKFNSISELSYDIAEEIANDRLATVASRVTDCVQYLAELELLDARLLAEGVISGRAIQEQYKTSLNKSKRAAQIEEYEIKGSPFPVPKTGVNAEETPVNAEETAVNSEETPQSKVKEIKVNTIVVAAENLLTAEEYTELCSSIGQADCDYYLERVKAFKQRNPQASFLVKATVLKWYREDKLKAERESKAYGEGNKNCLTVGKEYPAEELNALFDKLNEEL